MIEPFKESPFKESPFKESPLRLAACAETALHSNRPQHAITIRVLAVALGNLVDRLRRNAILNEADKATFYGGAHGYTDYPTLAEVLTTEDAAVR